MAVRLSEKQAHQLFGVRKNKKKVWSNKRPHKHNAVKTKVDGINFPSKAEARRYGELKQMLADGKISDLKIHKRFPIVVNGQKICAYECDAAYVDAAGRQVVEDTKSLFTAKLPVYRLKKKLMKACYGIEILEVMK